MVLSKKLITRYNELKQEAPDCLLLMQVGVFMKVMNDDAKTIADITGLNLQMAGTVEQPVVTGGFPHSGLDKYIGRIVRHGYSIAIAMQDESKERHINEIIKIQSVIK
jgi:DNA mismatch repair protein MutS